MRIYLLIIGLSFLSSYTQAKNLCARYLNKDIVIENNDITKILFSNPQSSQNSLKRILSKSEDIISLSLNLKILTGREASHLRSDIKELLSEANAKENISSFNDIVSRWEPMIFDVEAKLKEFQALPKNEQKQWKSKMELPVYFATAHFIVFLETKSKKFDYSKISNILEALEGKGVKDDLKLYLFVFEKQVRRFFSIREFRRCRA